MGEEQTAVCPWRDGNYSGNNMEALVLSGEKGSMSGAGSILERTFKHGDFGEVDEDIAEITGEAIYTVEMRFDIMGNECVNHGVLVEDGTKFVIKGFSGLLILEWVTEEEAQHLANDGDPISAPPSPYSAEPERQGKLLWISGPPGLGKSTSAQLLSRDHGYVYYEGDCFFVLKNPYIPPNVEGASLGQWQQRKLVGEGAAERRAMADKSAKQWRARMAGEEWQAAPIEEASREMFQDIARERARLGGDWVVACVLDTRDIRDLARSDS